MSHLKERMEAMIRQCNRTPSNIDFMYVDGFYWWMTERRVYVAEGKRDEDEIPWDTAVAESPFMQSYIEWMAKMKHEGKA